MSKSRSAGSDSRSPIRSSSLQPKAGFFLVLTGTIGNGISHWFIVWLIAVVFGVANLGSYSIVIAGATPIFIFLGLGLRNVYVSLREDPRWLDFLRWRLAGLSVAIVIFAIYCSVASAQWEIFLGVAVMKVSDGLLDIALARLQRQGRFAALGALTTANAALTIAATSIVSRTSAPVELMLVCAGLISLAVGIVAVLLGLQLRAQGPVGYAVGWRKIITAALPMTLSGGLMSLIASVPVWFLTAYSTPHEVGRFAGFAYLLVAANLFGASAQTILITSYRRLLSLHGVATLIRTMTRHILFIALCGVPLVAAVVLFGGPLLAYIYGPAFGASLLELLALGSAAVMCILGYLNSAAILVLNWYQSQLIITVASLLGATLPLLISIAVGATQWVLIAALAMTSAYVIRYFTAHLLLRSRRVLRYVPA